MSVYSAGSIVALVRLDSVEINIVIRNNANSYFTHEISLLLYNLRVKQLSPCQPAAQKHILDGKLTASKSMQEPRELPPQSLSSSHSPETVIIIGAQNYSTHACTASLAITM